MRVDNLAMLLRFVRHQRRREVHASLIRSLKQPSLMVRHKRLPLRLLME